MDTQDCAEIVCDLSIKIHRIMCYSDSETKKMVSDLITEFNKITMANRSLSDDTLPES